MYGSKSNTKINSSRNKIKRRSVGTNTEDNFRCTNCMNCLEDINHQKIYFVPYIPCMNNLCFQNNMARTINACKCKCSSQTNVHNHKMAFQCPKLLHGNRSSLPPWEKHIGDINERVPKTCQIDQMKNITKNTSKNNLSVSNSVPSVNANKPKQSHIPHYTVKRKTGNTNRLSNNLIDVERHASELLNENSRSQISDRLIENEDENSDELIDEDSKIYKLLVPNLRPGCDMDENDENCSASENEEAEDENAIHFSTLNGNQRTDEAMLMMMQAFVSDQSETKHNSKLSQLLNHLVPPGFVGESSNENKDMSFPFRKK